MGDNNGTYEDNKVNHGFGVKVVDIKDSNGNEIYSSHFNAKIKYIISNSKNY